MAHGCWIGMAAAWAWVPTRASRELCTSAIGHGASRIGDTATLERDVSAEWL
jgi:hypothetical protein